eukprot:scaffold164155_cov40-Tisochrysis_lutea.AAC.1
MRSSACESGRTSLMRALESCAPHGNLPGASRGGLSVLSDLRLADGSVRLMIRLSLGGGRASARPVFMEGVKGTVCQLAPMVGAPTNAEPAAAHMRI